MWEPTPAVAGLKFGSVTPVPEYVPPRGKPLPVKSRTAASIQISVKGVKVTTGNISSLTGLLDDTTNMQITAPIQPGNSGGPLLDNSGNIVGVVVARLEKDLSGNTAQNVNIAIKSNILQMLLSLNGITYDMSPSMEPKSVADIADSAKKSVTQVVCYE